MSNALSRDLNRLVKMAEDAQAARGGHGAFGQRIHLMPPTGWLNDPNGLCQKDGVFHAFFQYAPFDVMGGVKFWGHYVSRDLATWEYRGCPLMPDEPFDVHGVYSGSALVEDGKIIVLYTGNVKLPDAQGTYDYVNTGREGNTVLVASDDEGETFGEKRLVMGPADYPDDLTCHVRDPKVWREGDTYYMVQGTRRRVEGEHVESRYCAVHGEGAGRDVGEILVFSSTDLVTWRLVNRLHTPERFGFMWECPDYFSLEVPGGAQAHFLGCSPQGLEGGDWARRNIYSAGYFPLSGEVAGACALGAYHLWDAGFDFYAPQTFEAGDGRRIMIGWMGIPDEQGYDNQPTIDDGWQHCFTIPREVTVGEDGSLLQRPAREVEGLRREVLVGEGELAVSGETARCFDAQVTGVEDGFCAEISGELHLAWKPAEDGMPARFEMRFEGGREGAGRGRETRWEPLDEARDVRIIADSSSVEVFVNDGALVMSTRYYPSRYGIAIEALGACVELWPLG